MVLHDMNLCLRTRSLNLFNLSPLKVLVCIGFLWSVAEARVSWHTSGEYRLMSYLTDGFSLSEGDALAKQNWGRHRLRLRPDMEVGIVSVHLELDVLTGQVFGTRHNVGDGVSERRHVDRSDGYDGWTTLEPRLAWLEVKGPLLSLRLGQMESRWGLGLQSDRMKWKRPNFVPVMEETWNGDLLDQVEVEFRPLSNVRTDGWGRFSLTFGVGSVYQDEHAALLDDGEAYRFNSSARLPFDSLEIGLRAQRKLVTKTDDEVVDYTSSGGFVRWAEPLLALDSVFVLESELVYQTVSVRENSSLLDTSSVSFSGFAFVVASEFFSNCPQLGLRIEGGLSSGEGGVNGDSVFQVDPDFRPTVVALPVVERWLSAHYAKSPEVVGLVSEGSRVMLPSDGSLRAMGYTSLRGAWHYSRFMTTAAATLLWRTGDLKPVAGTNETLSIGRAGFVGTEVAGLAMYNLGDLLEPGWRIGVRWASFFPEGIAVLAEPIHQSSLRTEVDW
jgi:hypothetical protein